MNTRLATPQDKNQWNDFVLSSPQSSFMQSWQWGDMLSGFGLPVWRVVAEKNNKITGTALIVKREVSLGRCWLYIPHGPIFNQDLQTWRLLNEEIKKIAQKEKAIFIRSDMLYNDTAENGKMLTQAGWRKTKREVQPKNTLVLDLTQSEEEMMSRMHKKTRYNIRLAEKKGVTVRFSTDPEDLQLFLNLAAEVQSRGSFCYHPASYYREMLKALAPAGLLRLAIAEHEEKTLAAHLLIQFGDTVTYTHGSSSSSHKNLMAPHLLQWQSIKNAKKDGYEKYDFFGIAPKNADTNHPWAGITRFKLGFGGDRANYIGAHDFVLDSMFYTIYNVARRMKEVLR